MGATGAPPQTGGPLLMLSISFSVRRMAKPIVRASALPSLAADRLATYSVSLLATYLTNNDLEHAPYGAATSWMR